MEQIIEEIKQFIIRNDWGKTKKLTLNTSVEKDMGLSGLDAVDFIRDYSKEFNVDITTFDYSKYFYAEGGLDLLNPILNLFKNKEDQVNIRPERLTIQHLAEGILNKKLA
jgi:acyl carrier protein